ncbi:hypothetical protein MMC13_004532 [Lambiella insularis]|nr:hypothetical protein [Lambiella insularis]
MPTQYDSLSTTYKAMHYVPSQIIQIPNTRLALGPIAHYDILDLACGAGFYTNLLLDWGAASAVAIDISPAMIAEAQRSLAPDRAGRFSYLVGDCTTPGLLHRLGVPDERRFDLVHAAWLLNYAASEAELEAMWRNVASHLKPGGRFVGLIPNLDAEHGFEKPVHEDDAKYGVSMRTLERVAHGYKVRVTAHMEPRVEFNCYVLNEGRVYERAAAAAGMVQVEWKPVVPLPEDVERMEKGWWDGLVARPNAAVCTAVRA